MKSKALQRFASLPLRLGIFLVHSDKPDDYFTRSKVLRLKTRKNQKSAACFFGKLFFRRARMVAVFALLVSLLLAPHD